MNGANNSVGPDVTLHCLGTMSHMYGQGRLYPPQVALVLTFGFTGELQQGSNVYTQDLAAPLSQILSDGTTTYVYGQERLFGQQGSARTWYATDALGSVRQTLNDTGAATGSIFYDPWGQVQGGNVPTFGFTGELQQGSNVYLRARWYTAQRGTFTSKDPFAGWPAQPYSLMPYPYAYADPVLLRDPSGAVPTPPLPVDTAGNMAAAGMSAAILAARTVYSKYLSFVGCSWTLDDGQSNMDEVSDLFVDFICEYGPQTRTFNADALLTQQLAETVLIEGMRDQFYTSGPFSSVTSSQMDSGAFVNAKLFDSLRTGRLISITDFLGGVDASKVSWDTNNGEKTIRFEISNRTTLMSGTRIGFTRSGTAEISYEDYLNNPSLYNRDGSSTIDPTLINYALYSPVSVLSNKPQRDPTDKWGLGGGSITQIFKWEEKYDPCYWTAPAPRSLLMTN